MSIRILGYEDMNPRWVCWAKSQGLNPRTAGEVRREHPGKYELFTIYILRSWREFDEKHGYRKDHWHSKTDHEAFDLELAASVGAPTTRV